MHGFKSHFFNRSLLGTRLDDPELVIKDGDDDSIVSRLLQY